MRKAELFLLAMFVAIGSLMILPAAAQAQEEWRHEVGVQGTGFFTKDSSGNGISQRATDSGGFLIDYRYHFNLWLAAEGSYGYTRNSQQNFTFTGDFNVQSNIHQLTGAFLVTPPISIARVRPFLLAGTGALIFDPTDNPGGFVARAESQTKAAFVYGGGTDFGLDTLNSDAAAHTAVPSVGIVFRF